MKPPVQCASSAWRFRARRFAKSLKRFLYPSTISEIKNLSGLEEIKHYRPSLEQQQRNRQINGYYLDHARDFFHSTLLVLNFGIQLWIETNN